MAARFLYLTGPLYNSLARCFAAPVPSDASSIYGIGGLSDQYVENAFVFGSAGVNPVIAIDLNMLLNGSMALNSGGNVTLWTEQNTGGGDVIYNATGGPTGGPAASFTSSAGTASILQARNCRPGETLTLRCSLKGDGTHAINVLVQNLLDLRYLTSLGAWQTAPANVFTQTAASWAITNQLTFTVPSFSNQLWPLLSYVPLRVTIASTASAVACLATNCFLWPSTSFVSLHGYDAQPQLTLAFNKGGSADAGPSYTLQSALTVLRPAFYYATPSGLIGDRFLQVAWTGTPSTAPYIGEMVVGQYATLAQMHQYGGTVGRLMDQIRTKSAFGSTRVRSVAQMERRIWSASFTDNNPAAFADWNENVMRYSAYGATPIVIVPADGVLADVIHGELPASYSQVQNFTTWGDRPGITIPEDPFPSFLA